MHSVGQSWGARTSCLLGLQALGASERVFELQDLTRSVAQP